jgi:hypothetical protein
MDMRAPDSRPELCEGIVVALELHCEEYLEESYLDLTLSLPSQKYPPPAQDYVYLRFWSPRDFRITAEESRELTRAEFVQIKTAADSSISVRGYLRGVLSGYVTFTARAAEQFEEEPVRWDMVIDVHANLCLWRWDGSSGHSGIMFEELDIPQALTVRLKHWIERKRLEKSSDGELDAEGEQLAKLVFPHLGPSVILYLYSEAKRCFERVFVTAEVQVGL